MALVLRYHLPDSCKIKVSCRQKSECPCDSLDRIEASRLQHRLTVFKDQPDQSQGCFVWDLNHGAR